MKKIISMLLLMLMLFACVNISAESSISVELDANRLEFDAEPVNIDGRVLVPVRAIFEAMGATVSWDETTKTVTSVLSDTTVVMTIDSAVMTVNGEKKSLDVTPKIISDRTMVPARAATEAFGATVAWDAENNTVKIFTEEFYTRLEKIQIFDCTKQLTSGDALIDASFSISCFEEYDAKTNANDGTDFEISEESEDYFVSLSVRADAYSGIDHPVTEEYAHSVANDMVQIATGSLISGGVVSIGGEDFVEVHYTNAGVAGSVEDTTADVFVYTTVKNGVVYTVTYTSYGEVPQNIAADINYMIDTLIIH